MQGIIKAWHINNYNKHFKLC